MISCQNPTTNEKKETPTSESSVFVSPLGKKIKIAEPSKVMLEKYEKAKSKSKWQSKSKIKNGENSIFNF